jgi:uncharacterized protein (TIGR02270 family)
MPESLRPLVILDILEEHFEELEFLWEQRGRVIFSSDWNLARLAALEARADAHLDGLLVGSDHTVDLVRPLLAGDDVSAATTACFALVNIGNGGLADEVLRALSEGTAAVRDGVRTGLRHCQVADLFGELTDLASSGEPVVRAAALDVLAFHRMPAPAKLAELLAVSDPVVRGLAFDSVGRIGGPWSIDLLLDALDGEDSNLQKKALETSARLGMTELPSVCREVLKRGRRPLPEVLTCLGMLGHPEDIKILEEASTSRDLALAALGGLGAMGNVAVIPHLLNSMREPELAPAAGAAFVRITGAVGIEAAAHPSSDLGGNELELEQSVVGPDPERADRWWEQNKSRFRSESRWQFGANIDQSSFAVASRHLPLSARRDLYLALRAKGGDRVPDIELEARVCLQTEGSDRAVPS